MRLGAVTFAFGFKTRKFDVFDLRLQFADAFRLPRLILQLPLKPADPFSKVR